MVCMKCGKTIESTEIMCADCIRDSGGGLRSDDIRSSSEKRKKKLRKILIIVGSLLIVIAICVSAFLQMFKPKNDFFGIDYIVDTSKELLKEVNSGSMPEIIYDKKDKIPSFILGSYTKFKVLDGNAAIKSLNTLKKIMNFTNPEEEFKLEKVNETENGKSYRLQQYFKGVLVYAKQLVVSTDKKGKTLSLSGDYDVILSLDVTPKITEELAKKKALEEFGDKATAQNATLVIFSNSKIKSTLAWKIKITGTLGGKFVNQFKFIRATDKFVLATENLVKGEGVDASGYDIKGRTRSFKAKQSSSKFLMCDPTRNITIYDMATDKIYDSSSATSWTSKAGVSGIYNMGIVYDFFKIHGLNSYDNNGAPINVYIDPPIQNAYWSDPNFVFGESTGEFSNLTGSLDVVGHEFTHAIISSSGQPQLNFDGTPGTLDEAYADILGNLIENITENTDEWTNAEDSMINGNKPFRNYENPTSQGDPEVLYGQNYQDPSDEYDDGGRHVNSTIVTHSAYLMWKNGLGFGLDKETMFKLWYNSLAYLSKDSGYEECRAAVVMAAKNMALSDDAQRVIKESFVSTGMGKPELTGKVTKADTDLDLTNNVSIPNCKITLSSVSSFSNDENTYADTPIVKTSDANGAFTYPEIPMGMYDIKFEISGYTTFEDTISVNGMTNMKVTLDKFTSNTLTGKINVADADMDFSNNLPLEGASLEITKKTGSVPMTETTTTDYRGEYTFSNLVEGLYSFTIYKEGYLDTTQLVAVKANQVNYYNAIIEAVPVGYDGNGGASGKIVDVLNGNGVSSLTLKLRRGMSNISRGIIYKELLTSSGGLYSVSNLPAGTYCFEIIDGRELPSESKRYLKSYTNIKILGNKTIANQDGAVSTSLNTNQLRIRLRWGSLPRDLDSHFRGPKAGGGTFETYYPGSMKKYFEGSKLVAALDLDDTTSYGPETTTLYYPRNGLYEFYVRDYTNYKSRSSTALSTSNATVEVYVGASSVPTYVFAVPDGAGTTWKVFTYNSVNQTITPSNQMSYKVLKGDNGPGY